MTKNTKDIEIEEVIIRGSLADLSNYSPDKLITYTPTDEDSLGMRTDRKVLKIYVGNSESRHSFNVKTMEQRIKQLLEYKQRWNLE